MTSPSQLKPPVHHKLPVEAPHVRATAETPTPGSISLGSTVYDVEHRAHLAKLREKLGCVLDRRLRPNRLLAQTRHLRDVLPAQTLQQHLNEPFVVARLERLLPGVAASSLVIRIRLRKPAIPSPNNRRNPDLLRHQRRQQPQRIQVR